MARYLVGTRIREIRRMKNLTQKHLAERIDISAPYLNLIEHNKRRIGGKTLNAIARALDIDTSQLNASPEHGLVNRVISAASENPQILTEINRAEDFIAQFPGFARLIGRQNDQIKLRNEEFAILSDQLKHDPYFAEAMHLLLSTITSIRSTADILDTTVNISDASRRRFISNLAQEAIKLSKTAEEIFDYFEVGQENETVNLELSTFEALLERNQYFLTDMEIKGVLANDIMDSLSIKKGEVASTRACLLAYERMTKEFPIEAFLKQATALRYNPLALVKHYESNLVSICFRMAHLPKGEDVPEFGFIQTDASGAVLYRKQLSGFSLPRFGGACGLWPVYRCLSQILQPIFTILDMPVGDRFHALSYAYPVDSGQYGLPPKSEAIMLFTKDYHLLDPCFTRNIPELAIGAQCPVCSRQNCSARRAAYLLADI